MASQVELESIMVKLLGDGTSYQRMLEQAIASTEIITGRVENLGRKVNAAIVLPLREMGKWAVGSFSSFDNEMVKATSIMAELGDEQVKTMKELALSLSETGPQAAADMARAYYYLASAGLTANQSIAALPVLQKFATAGAFDMVKATDLSTGAVSALGLASKDAGEYMTNLTRVTDVMARGTTLAKTTTEQLAEALASGAASAMKTFGKDVEEGAAVLLAFSDQLIRGHKAGYDFQRLMLQLQNSTLKFKDAQTAAGFSVFDSTGKIRNFADIIKNLEDITAGLSSQGKFELFASLGLGATRVQQVVLPLLGMSDAIRQFEKELRSASGYTDSVAAKQMASFANQLNIVKNSITNLGIEIGQTVAPALGAMGKGISTVLNLWRQLDSTIRAIIISVVALTGAGITASFTLGLIGPLLRTGLTILLGPLNQVSGLMHHLMDPIALLRPAILGIAGIVLTLINPIKLVLSSFTLLWGATLLWANPLFVVFKTLFSIGAYIAVLSKDAGGIGALFEEWTNKIVEFWNWLEPVRTALESLARSLFTVLVDAFNAAGKEMKEAMDWVMEQINVDWDQVRQFIVRALTAVTLVIRNIGPIAEAVWESMRSSVEFVSGVVKIMAGDIARWASETAGSAARVAAVIGIVAAAFLTAATAIKVVVVAYGFLNAVATALHLQQIAGIAIWVAWKAVVILATIAAVGFSAALNLIQISAWLATAAITAMDAAMAAGEIVTAVITLTAISVTITAIAAGAWLVYTALKAVASASATVVQSFFSLGTSFVPLMVGQSVFSEWLVMLDNIITVMQEDMPAAWELMNAAAKVGIEQVKQYLPPTLNFLVQTGQIYFKLFGDVFVYEFDHAIDQAIISANRLFEFMDPLGILKKPIDLLEEAQTRNNEERIKQAIANAKGAVNLLTKSFPTEPSEGLKKAREEYNKLAQDIETRPSKDPPSVKVAKSIQDLLDKFKQKGKEDGKEYGNALADGFKESKFEAAIFGSTEYLTRLADYTTYYNENIRAKGVLAGPSAVNKEVQKHNKNDIDSADLALARNASNMILAKANEKLAKGDKADQKVLMDLQRQQVELLAKIADKVGSGSSISIKEADLDS